LNWDVEVLHGQMMSWVVYHFISVSLNFRLRCQQVRL
jgi:hypothetical protein